MGAWALATRLQPKPHTAAADEPGGLRRPGATPQGCSAGRATAATAAGSRSRASGAGPHVLPGLLRSSQAGVLGHMQAVPPTGGVAGGALGVRAPVLRDGPRLQAAMQAAGPRIPQPQHACRSAAGALMGAPADLCPRAGGRARHNAGSREGPHHPGAASPGSRITRGPPGRHLCAA